MTLNSATGVLSVSTNNMAHIGPYTVTIKAGLVSYGAVPLAEVSITVNIVDPCPTTVLSMASLSTFTITAHDPIGAT